MEKEYVILANNKNCKMEEISKLFQDINIYEFDDIEELLFTIRDLKEHNTNIIAFI